MSTMFTMLTVQRYSIFCIGNYDQLKYGKFYLKTPPRKKLNLNFLKFSTSDIEQKLKLKKSFYWIKKSYWHPVPTLPIHTTISNDYTQTSIISPNILWYIRRNTMSSWQTKSIKRIVAVVLVRILMFIFRLFVLHSLP